MNTSFNSAGIQAAARRNRGTVLFFVALLGSTLFAQTATSVTQLRGTIKDISASGNKPKDEASFELNATEEKYSLRVIESSVQPARAGYYVSNGRDIFSCSVTAETANVREATASKSPLRELVSFRQGSLPNALAPRAQVIAYAHLALRLPKTGSGDAEFVEQVMPRLVVSAAEMEKSDVQAQVLRSRDGSLERVNFWGFRPGTDVKTFENTKDTFLLASLVATKAAGPMPVAGVFTVFGKRPEAVTRKLGSFERKRYEISGTVGFATDKDAFGWLTYYPGPIPKRITVFDYRFLGKDNGKTRSYDLNLGDELPFAEEKLPSPYYLMPKPNSSEAPQVVRKAMP